MHELAWGWCEPLQDKVTAFAESQKRNAYYNSRKLCAAEKVWQPNSCSVSTNLTVKSPELDFFWCSFSDSNSACLFFNFDSMDAISWTIRYCGGEWMPAAPAKVPAKNEHEMISDHESWWYITSSVALCTSLFALNSLSYDSRNCWNCKKKQFWNLLGELVVLILKPLQLLRSSLAVRGISEIEPGWIAPTDRRAPNHPNLVAWGSALLHFLLDGSVTIVQLLDSLRNLCLALLPNGCSSTTGPTKLKSWQIFANVAPLSQIKPTNTKLLHFLQLLVLVLKAVLELHILMGHLRACRLGLQIASFSVFTAKILSGSLRSIVYRDESCVQKPHC